MKSTTNSDENLSRKNFFKVAATGASASVSSSLLASCASSAAETEAALTAGELSATGEAVIPKYDLNKSTAYDLTMKEHAWLDWYHNAPVIHEYRVDPPYKIGYITSWRGEPWQEVNIAEFTREVNRSSLITDFVHMDSAGSVDTEINNLKDMFTMWKAGSHGARGYC